MFKDNITMYVWGTPVPVTLDVYLWVMNGETRSIRFKRAIMVLNNRENKRGGIFNGIRKTDKQMV